MNAPQPPWNDPVGPSPETGVPRQTPPGYGPADPNATAPHGAGYGPPPFDPGPQAPGPGARWGTERHPLAGWGPRFLARLIDLGVVTLPVLLAAIITAMLWAGVQTLALSYPADAVERNAGIIGTVVAYLLYVGYEVVCVAAWRQTVGKRVMGIQVAPAAGAGRQGPIPFSAILARAAFFSAPSLLVFSVVLSWVGTLLQMVLCGLMPLWDRPNRQGLHDKIAGTVVVRTR